MGVDQGPQYAPPPGLAYRGDLVLRARISEEDSLGLNREKH